MIDSQGAICVSCAEGLEQGCVGTGCRFGSHSRKVCVLFFELLILSTQSSTLQVLTFKLTLQTEVSIVREKLNYF